jgi:hypothetical protein
MRQRSVTVTVLYEDDKDDLALIALDKMSDWLIDIDGIEAKDTKFHEARDADVELWADYFYDWENDG